MNKRRGSNKIWVLIGCISLILCMGISFSAVKNEITGIKSNMSIILKSGSQTLSTISYNGESYVPLKKIAALLDKTLVIDPKNTKATITDKTVGTKKITAVMEMNSGEKVELELYPDLAPITVANFVKLSKSGFYKGLTFHRVIDGFMIQGGDPKGNGTGDPGYKIKGEFMKNGVSNGLLHEKGVISMARASDYNSAGCQFFIMLEAQNSLNGDYAAFGKVVKGIEVIEKIGKTPTDSNDKPKTPQVIKSITIK